MSNLHGALDRARRAASVAINRNRRISNKPTDPDLQLFENLTEDQFDNIAKIYGEENTLKYIKMMEARRMKQGE